MERINKQRVELDVTEQIFSNAPNMLALCLTMVGLIKIYSALKQITTLTDNFLVLCLFAFLLATICSYLALRSPTPTRRATLSRLAHVLFLSGLCGTVIVAIFIVFTLAG